MKIAIDAVELEGNPTGVGRYLGNMLNSWSEVAPSEEIFLIHKEEIPSQFLKHPGIRLVQLKRDRFSNGLLRQQVALPQALKKIAPDLLFAPAYNMPLMWGGPSVLTVHDISFESYPQWFSRIHGARMRFLTRASINKATRVICDSQFIRQEILDTYRINPKKIDTVYLGFDESLLDLPFTPEKTLRERYWIYNPFALMAGTIFERRYPLEVIQAFADSRLENQELVIAGADRRLAGGDLQAEIERLGLREMVSWLDYVPSEDLMGLYRCADCLIYLSEYEGFGLPPLEGMAFGLPVLVSAKGTLKEIYGEAALTVNNENPVEIAGALEKLFRDESAREEYISRGKKLVSDLTYRKCAEQTFNILKKALE